MFFFGLSGSVLPYLISIVAIWSGIWLGYGKYITQKPTPEKDSEKITEHKSHVPNPTGKIALFSQTTNTPENQVQQTQAYFSRENILLFRPISREKYFACCFTHVQGGYYNYPKNKAPPKLS